MSVDIDRSSRPLSSSIGICRWRSAPPAPSDRICRRQLDNDGVERFLRYVQVDTQSDGDRKTSPSTAEQWTWHVLADELKAIGLEDVT